MPTKSEIQQSIIALEAQRAILGDVVVNAALTGLQAQLAQLNNQQRKQVTVLFASLPDFATFAEFMDVEDVESFLIALWQHLDPIIVNHNGYVDKHMEGTLMAVWGMRAVAEDDPEQAARAAVKLQHLFNSLYPTYSGLAIAIHTGSALLSSLGTDENQTVMGDTINTVGLLAEKTPPNHIIITQDTARHLPHYIQLSDHPPLTIKGKQDPINVYTLNAIQPRSLWPQHWQVANISTPFVGRITEQEKLYQSWLTTQQNAITAQLLLIGTAGMGKSRLLHQFTTTIQQKFTNPLLLMGQAQPRTQTTPYSLWRSFFTFYAHILDTDTPDTIAHKLTQALHYYLPDQTEMKAYLLGTLLGYNLPKSLHLEELHDDPEQLRNRSLLYLTQFLTAITYHRPTIIILEDIHWADQHSLDTLTEIINRLPQLPLLIILSARPHYLETHPQSDHKDSILNLSPLSLTDHQQLLTAILHKLDTIPSNLTQLLYQRSAGNPYYLEELLKMLIDEGILITQTPNWQFAADKFDTHKIPTTLIGLLQASLDRLTPAEKETLQQAAVIGTTFWDKTLAHLSPLQLTTTNQTPPKLQHILDSLILKDFITLQSPSSFENTQQFSFKHALFRDITYDTVLKKERAQYHQKVANWLSQQLTANKRHDDFASFTAQHYLLGQNYNEAQTWYQYALQQAMERFAHEEALQLIHEILSILDETDYHTRYQLYLQSEHIYSLQANRTAQAHILDQLASIIPHLDNQAHLELLLRRATMLIMRSDYSQALTYLHQAIDLATTDQTFDKKAQAYQLWGSMLRMQGQYHLAIEKLSTGLSIAQTNNFSSIEATCLLRLGQTNRQLTNYPQAQQFYQQALTIFQTLKHRKGESQCLNSLGIVALYLGNFDSAQNYYQQSLEIARYIGDRHSESICLNNLGIISYDMNAYDSARTYYQKSLAIKQAHGDRRGSCLTLINIGLIFYQEGNHQVAQQHLNQALAISQQIGERWGESNCLNKLGMFAIDQQNYSAARNYLQQSLAIAEDIGDREGKAVALRELASLYDYQNDITTSKQLYLQALTLHQELNQPHYIIEAQAGVALAYLKENNLPQSLELLPTLLTYLEQYPELTGLTHPYRLYKVVILILQKTDKQKALAWTQTAYHQLQQKMSKFPNSNEQQFFNNIADHRDILSLYHQSQ
ncbi:MAG TPA: tetratricopeptide repeat protein [Anaerolineae bacterium]|nr:tetratricopeptide repeat protein [Anaerolineae bacterium]